MIEKDNGRDFMGQIAIRHGSEFSKPLIVYVEGVSKMLGDVNCKVLNTEQHVFGGDFESVNMIRFRELNLIWDVENYNTLLETAKDKLNNFNAID